MSANTNAQTVYAVDDDPLILTSLRELFDAIETEVVAFTSSEDLLSGFPRDARGCLILDVRLPDTNGLEVLRVFRRDNPWFPVIMFSGFGDIPMAVEAMREGAFDFIQKPFRPQNLLDLVRRAFAFNHQAMDRLDLRMQYERRTRTLSKREAEVMDLLVQGLSVKQIAYEFDLSHKTVHIHRSRVLERMGVGTVVELVNIAYGRVSSARDTQDQSEE